MSHKLFWLASAAAFCIPIGAHSQEKLLVQVPALLDPSAPIVESVRRECKVETLVGNHVFEKVSERLPSTGQISEPAKAGSDKVLKLTIVGVLGAGGGAWSGSKAITIRADLLKDSKVVATKQLSRQSGGGVFGGLKGTCSIMERIAVALGSDVAAWVPSVLSLAPLSEPAPPSPAPATPASPASPAPAEKPEPKQ